MAQRWPWIIKGPISCVFVHFLDRSAHQKQPSFICILPLYTRSSSLKMTQATQRRGSLTLIYSEDKILYLHLFCFFFFFLKNKLLLTLRQNFMKDRPPEMVQIFPLLFFFKVPFLVKQGFVLTAMICKWALFPLAAWYCTSIQKAV